MKEVIQQAIKRVMPQLSSVYIIAVASIMDRLFSPQSTSYDKVIDAGVKTNAQQAFQSGSVPSLVQNFIHSPTPEAAKLLAEGIVNPTKTGVTETSIKASLANYLASSGKALISEYHDEGLVFDAADKWKHSKNVSEDRPQSGSALEQSKTLEDVTVASDPNRSARYPVISFLSNRLNVSRSSLDSLSSKELDAKMDSVIVDDKIGAAAARISSILEK